MEDTLKKAKQKENTRVQELTATNVAKRQCSKCSNDCKLKNLRGHCKLFVDKEDK